MIFKFDNLGLLRDASIEIGDLTIICGLNNTGKTYASYAIYGFLVFWREAFELNISNTYISELMKNGNVIVNLEPQLSRFDATLRRACEDYKMQLPMIFAADESLFKETSFEIQMPEIAFPLSDFDKTYGTSKTRLLRILHEINSKYLRVELLITEQSDAPVNLIKTIVSDAIKDIITAEAIPNCFFSSTERTGIASFMKELNFARNRLLEDLSTMKNDLNPFELINKVYTDYSMPIRRNCDFARNIDSMIKRTSFIKIEYPEILEYCSEIVGGEYRYVNGQVVFIPKKNRKLRLSLGESSSSVRSLLDIWYYLNHQAQKGDMLFIDEPESNLHPESQRKLARLLARLVNIGIRIFITTHSDYMIKEFNSLILLSQDEEDLKQIGKSYGYEKSEYLSATKIRAYVAKRSPRLLEGNKKRVRVPTIEPMKISQSKGIQTDSFDDALVEMENIVRAIYYR